MRQSTFVWLAVMLGLACAAISWLGLAGWLAVVVVVASIAMHGAGNCIGTNLRDAADQRLERVSKEPLAALPHQAPSHLQQHSSLGRLVPVSACIGAVCGGLTGSVALVVLASASLAGAILGGISSAVLGGLFGFLAASFIEILRTSLREALAAEREG